MRINAGIHKGRTLVVPKGGTVRPTFTKLKQAVFNICSQYLEGARFLDLFAGAGGMGLEALSRGAGSALFVEKDKKAVEAIHENIQKLGEEKRARVMPTDVFEALRRLSKNGQTFDLIFADPPYGRGSSSLSDQVLMIVDSLPLLKKGGELFLEDAMEAYDPTLKLSSLLLKSERRMGRALLRNYCRKEDA